MTRNRLAAETPWYPPGTRQAYGAGTFGHLVGEVVAASTAGRSTPSSAKRSPLRCGLEPFGPARPCGRPGLARDPRVAPTIKADPSPPGEPMWASCAPPGATPMRAGVDPAPPAARSATPTRAGARRCPAEFGGITNARGLAGLYAPLARAISSTPMSETGDTPLRQRHRRSPLLVACASA